MQMVTCHGSKTVQLFLERSKEMPLTLEIRFDHRVDHRDQDLRLQEILDHPAFLAITDQAHRWASLVLSSENAEDLCVLRPPIISCCPELKTLELARFWDSIEGVVLDFVPMPKLTSFHGEYFQPLQSTHSLPWHQLTRLKLNATHDVPQLIELCENLLDLSIQIDPHWEIDVTYRPMSTPHQNLERLCLCLLSTEPEEPESDTVKRLLESFYFPQLIEFEIINESCEPHEQVLDHCTFDTLTNFVNACSCALAHLALCDICISDSDLIAFLRNVPSLTSVAIKDPHDTSAATSVSYPLSIVFINSLGVTTQSTDPDSSDLILLPNLRSVFLVIRKECDEMKLVEMISSRWNVDEEEEDIACLDWVTIRIQMPAVDLEKLEPLKDLKAEGLDLVITIGMQDVDFI
ncbi:hypothetical protein BT96DRAFT_999491 [Gymnopus androsaceus JB14]|uniref:F-box domain-containing protein n=1 Tax=Gymnopus androsaceus JB14 TaxID=1447944 RepID=A0A6A4H858_9AGAR|nr:hypothetical protein BT96DRAFT_999491 [Gymnopus androsaceus JB14]